MAVQAQWKFQSWAYFGRNTLQPRYKITIIAQTAIYTARKCRSSDANGRPRTQNACLVHRTTETKHCLARADCWGNLVLVNFVFTIYFSAPVYRKRKHAGSLHSVCLWLKGIHCNGQATRKNDRTATITRSQKCTRHYTSVLLLVLWWCIR